MRWSQDKLPNILYSKVKKTRLRVSPMIEANNQILVKNSNKDGKIKEDLNTSFVNTVKYSNIPGTGL